jgi:hypothetical protein
MRLGTSIVLSCLFTLQSAVGGVTPIDENTQNRLQSVVDGLDTRDEGFAALVEHVQEWEGTAQTLETPEMQTLVQQPTQYRGELFYISGEIELVEQLPPPWEGVTELFVRDKNDSVFGVYVVGGTQFSLQQTIQAPSVFYKTISIEGRDQQKRTYPTFITNRGVLNTTKSDVASEQTLFALLLLGIIGILAYLFYRMTTSKKQVNRRVTIKTQEVLDATEEVSGVLPEDSSEALAVMYEQSKEDV